MKYCKRVTLAILAMLAMATSSAQDINCTVGDKSNSKGYQPTMILVDKADADGMYYTVEPDLNLFSKVMGIVVREVDFNFKEANRAAIENSKGADILYAHREGTTMHVILDCTDKKHLALRHVSVDLTSFTITGDSLLVDAPTGKKVDIYHWDAASPSGNHYGLIYALYNSKTDQSVVKALLFDGAMQRQWTRDLNISAISQMFVTDDGRIATGGFINGEGDNDGARLEFAIIDANNIQHGHTGSYHKVSEVTLLNCFGDKVLATALETDNGTGWAGSFTVGAVITQGTVYTGCTAYLFNTGTGRVENSSTHTFTKEDARVFYNASLVTDITSPDINYLSAHAKVTTPQGGAVLYRRSWLERVVRYGQGTEETFRYRGMMLFNVDSLGNITWTRPIMHHNSANASFTELAETDLVVVGDNIYLFTNELSDESEKYNPEKAARPPLLRICGAVSAYIFSPEGNVTKRMVKTDGTTALLTRLRPQSNGRYTFISGGMLGHISEITIK